jgi:hypothetical protein
MSLLQERLQVEPLLEGLVELILKPPIPELKLQCPLGFPQYPFSRAPCFKTHRYSFLV